MVVATEVVAGEVTLTTTKVVVVAGAGIVGDVLTSTVCRIWLEVAVEVPTPTEHMMHMECQFMGVAINHQFTLRLEPVGNSTTPTKGKVAVMVSKHIHNRTHRHPRMGIVHV